MHALCAGQCDRRGSAGRIKPLVGMGFASDACWDDLSAGYSWGLRRLQAASSPMSQASSACRFAK